MTTIRGCTPLGVAVCAWAVGGAAALAQGDPMLEDQLARMERTVCPAPGAEAPAEAADAYPDLTPTRVFDNLYVMGTPSSSAWAVATSDGIILIDAMWEADVEEVVVEGLQSLGLDPRDIKIVLVTHAHGDHFGGSSYLQENYGAQVAMSHADWYYLATWPQRGEPAPLPRRDITVLDGDALTLGDTTVDIIVTPGHTPGTVSPMLTVHDGDNTHRAGYWSGASMSFLSPEELEVYVRSIDRYQSLAEDAGVDVMVSNHVFADGADVRAAALAGRAAGEPHPFVIGEAGVREWLTALRGCATSLVAQKRSQAPLQGQD